MAVRALDVRLFASAETETTLCGRLASSVNHVGQFDIDLGYSGYERRRRAGVFYCRWLITDLNGKRIRQHAPLIYRSDFASHTRRRSLTSSSPEQYDARTRPCRVVERIDRTVFIQGHRYRVLTGGHLKNAEMGRAHYRVRTLVATFPINF